MFGLDLGINNVGWAVVDRVGEDVLDMGVYVFESPLVKEEDATKGTKSGDRGTKRRARRTLRRRSLRRRRLYRLLADHGFLPRSHEERVEFLCRHKFDGEEVHPYALREKALHQRLEPFELGRALCHLNQRRGFLSPRELMLVGVARVSIDADESDQPDARGMLKEIQKTREALREFPTLGAFLAARLSENQPVRRKTAAREEGKKTALKKSELDRYWVRPDRKMYEDEFDAIVAAQRKYHPLLTDSVVQEIRAIVFNQIPIGAQIGLRGKCTFFKKETRAKKASLAGQRFVIAQDVAHLKYVDMHGEGYTLEPAQRTKLVDELMEGKDLAWKDVKALLELPPAVQFDVEPPPGKKRASGCKESLKGSKTVAAFKDAIGEKWDRLGPEGQRILVGEVLSVGECDDKNKSRSGTPIVGAAGQKFKLFKRKAYGPQDVRFTEREAALLATLALPKGFLNVSLKAIKKIVPHLIDGKVYSEACAAAGLNHARPMGDLEPVDHLEPAMADGIKHPLVRCSVLSAIRVVNALIREFGMPAAIHVELPRDLARSKEQREEFEKFIRDNENENQRRRKELLQAGYPVTRENMLKLELWEQCGKALPYEPSETVASLQDLIEGPYQIDHIVPRSHNYDSSKGNLTLCTRDFNNLIKKNLCLYEAVQAWDRDRWKEIETHVRGLKSMPKGKRDRILARELPEQDFTGRHLAATGYISKSVLAMLKRLRDVDVVVAQGSATADLRRSWGLQDLLPLHPEEEKKREEFKAATDPANYDEGKKTPSPPKLRSNYLHHAVDALVVALTDRQSLRQVADYYKKREETGLRPESGVPPPIPGLRSKASKALEAQTVVHRPHRTATGDLHKQMPEKPDENIPVGRPFERRVVGKKLVCFDIYGRPAQAYPLENNHHVVIYERSEPDAKGRLSRYAEVVTMIEACRRRIAGEPAIRKSAPPGFRFVMALCKNDMVEMEDGAIGVVSKVWARPKDGDVGIAIWHPFVAKQEGQVNSDNPYLLRMLQSANGLSEIRARVVLDPLGEIRFREGDGD